MDIVNRIHKDKIQVNVYRNRSEMGKAAASAVAERITGLLAAKEEINMVFAAAPSQNEFLEALINDKRIEWGKINAFHLDEYIGLAEDAPQGFGNFLKGKLFGKVNFKNVYYINGAAENIKNECERYAGLLKEYPLDIACIGIGENGHLAFNDPPTADFNDQLLVKTVLLDDICRKQQVNDGCFPNLEDVPVQAFTLTIPAIVAAEYIYCIVPGKAKAEAIYNTLNGPVLEKCPASIIREHDAAEIYLDVDSASMIIKA